MVKLQELDSYGVLSLSEVPPAYARLTQDERHLLTTLFLESSKTLPKRFASKHYSAECLLSLDVAGYVEWQTDKHGKPSTLGLTWRGEDAATTFLKVAKYKSRQRTT